jgi:glycosyltransferase involved in cell wall biosynthesis
MIDVVIPARNEERTIGAIVKVLAEHPTIGQIWIGVDADTTDLTAAGLRDHSMGVHVRNFNFFEPKIKGKGQICRFLIHNITTERVMFCDADLTGLTPEHIDQLMNVPAMDAHGMVIGVPDYPIHALECMSTMLDKRPMEQLFFSWPWVSGQRVVPTVLVRDLPLHGYLMETQINAAAKQANLPVRFERLRGLVSPFNMSDRRLAEMERDRQWGLKEGIL